jgi:hypothetical protein
MVVGEIRAKHAAEMPLVEDDHMVQTLAANGADHALHVGILLWAKRTRHDLGDAEASDPPTHLVVVDAVPVSQQPSGSGVTGGRPRRAAGRSTRRWGAR